MEYAKTIDVKRIQEERGKGRKDRYADTNRNNAGRRWIKVNIFIICNIMTMLAMSKLINNIDKNEEAGQ